MRIPVPGIWKPLETSGFWGSLPVAKKLASSSCGGLSGTERERKPVYVFNFVFLSFVDFVFGVRRVLTRSAGSAQLGSSRLINIATRGNWKDEPGRDLSERSDDVRDTAF